MNVSCYMNLNVESSKIKKQMRTFLSISFIFNQKEYGERNGIAVKVDVKLSKGPGSIPAIVEQLSS